MSALNKLIEATSFGGATDTAALIARRTACVKLALVAQRMEDLLSVIERRCGSASRQSGYTDATECAEWIRTYFADAQKIVEGE